MIELKDQIGKWVRLENFPKRIVSLVPSITELLFDLGLEEEVVGITKFCVHPETWFKTKTRVGGTKTVEVEKVAALSPDLIIANKEENVKEQVEVLEATGAVYTSDISNLEEALQMIQDIGCLAGKSAPAGEMVKKIRDLFNQVVPLEPSPRICYLVWQQPFITAGGDTFINDMLERCGFENIFKDQLRYPAIDLQQLLDKKCELLLLSSEPFPFREKHIAGIEAQIAELTKQGISHALQIKLVNGEFFSWYGSRMLLAGDYFMQLQNSNFQRRNSFGAN